MYVQFKQLKASLANNAGAEPNLYMAVCLIETLFYDLEQESGVEPEKCADGDSTLPTKLIWLCKRISAIYREKEAGFVRNRENLAKAVTKLQETETALESFTDVGEQLTQAQKRLNRAEERLKEARALQADVAAREQEAQQLERELERLQSLDMTAAQARVTQLQQAVRQAAQALADFRAGEIEPRELELRQAGERQTAAEAEKAALDGQLAEAREKLQQAEKELAAAKALQADAEACTRRTEELKAELRQLEFTDMAAAREEAETLRKQVEQAGQALADYRASEILPLEQRMKEAGERQAAAEAEKAELDRQLAALQEQIDAETAAKNAKILSLAGQQQLLADKQKETADKNSQLEAAKARVSVEESKLTGLNNQIGELAGKLGELQDAEAELAGKRDSVIRSRTDAEQRIQALGADTAALEAGLAELQEKAEAMQKEFDEKQAAFNNRQAAYNALTDSLNTQKGELARLSERLEQLQGQNVEETYNTVKRQKEEEVARLEGLKTQTEALEAENRQLDEQITADQKKIGDLEGYKEQKNRAAEDSRRYLQELQKVVTPDYRRQTEQLAQRLALLKETRNAMDGTLRELRSALNADPLEGQTELAAAMGDTLAKLNAYAADCGRNLKKCADLVSQGLKEEA